MATRRDAKRELAKRQMKREGSYSEPKDYSWVVENAKKIAKAEEAQGKGYGQDLVDKAVKFAQDKTAEHIKARKKAVKKKARKIKLRSPKSTERAVKRDIKRDSRTAG